MTTENETPTPSGQGWRDVFEAHGYRRYPPGMAKYSSGLYQRRLYRAADSGDDMFVNFEHYEPDERIARAQDHFTGWVQVDSPASAGGTSVRIETFTHTGDDIASRLSEIEAELVRLAEASITPSESKVSPSREETELLAELRQVAAFAESHGLSRAVAWMIEHYAESYDALFTPSTPSSEIVPTERETER